MNILSTLAIRPLVILLAGLMKKLFFIKLGAWFSATFLGVDWLLAKTQLNFPDQVTFVVIASALALSTWLSWLAFKRHSLDPTPRSQRGPHGERIVEMAIDA
jgi:hypothetical protein